MLEKNTFLSYNNIVSRIIRSCFVCDTSGRLKWEKKI